MNEQLSTWIAQVEALRPEMNALAKRLEQYGAIVTPEDEEAHEGIRPPLSGELAYHAEFSFLDTAAVTTIRFLLLDYQTKSDVVITNMTTLPEDKKRRGCGSRAVQAVLMWARDNRLHEVRATQVSGQNNETFWHKNGFTQWPPPNPCNDFVHVIAHRQTP